MVANLLFCWCGRWVVVGAMPPYSVAKVVALGSIGHDVKGGHVNLSGVNIVVSKMENTFLCIIQNGCSPQ